MSNVQKRPTAEEIKAENRANYREFKRLRAENPFLAASLLHDVGSASIEAGRLAEEQPEPPPTAA